MEKGYPFEQMELEQMDIQFLEDNIGENLTPGMVMTFQI